MKKMTNHIMVNLPPEERDYLSGNGEGVWVLVDEETLEAYNRNSDDKNFVGILDNDSIYYPGLRAGMLIPFEMRGEYRPVVDFYTFLSTFENFTQECQPPICCDCQFCGDKFSFPEPNDLIEMDPENPLLKHFYCCCGDSEHYMEDITVLDIQECEHFEEL